MPKLAGINHQDAIRALGLALFVTVFTWLAHVTFGEHPTLYAVSFYAGLMGSVLAMMMGLCILVFSASRWKALTIVVLSSTWWIWLFWIMQRHDLFP